MPEQPNRPQEEQVAEEVWNAIAVFEKILEAMPEDRASLDALSHAYEQIGDHTRAKEYLIRLGDILAREGDLDAVWQMVDRVRPYAAADERAAELLRRIEGMAPEPPPELSLPRKEIGAPDLKAGLASKVRMTFNMADELAMAWNLMEAGQLTQEEYSSVIQDLTEMSQAESEQTVSVLHALHARGFRNLEKILSYLAEECGTPIIAPESFDVRSEIASALPRGFAVNRGAVIFETVGKDALCAVMNPYDKQLRRDVEVLATRRCHFFTCLPSTFDQTLERLANFEETAQDE